MEIHHFALQTITCQDAEQTLFSSVTVHGLVLDSVHLLCGSSVTVGLTTSLCNALPVIEKTLWNPVWAARAFGKRCIYSSFNHKSNQVQMLFKCFIFFFWPDFLKSIWIFRRLFFPQVCNLILISVFKPCNLLIYSHNHNWVRSTISIHI